VSDEKLDELVALVNDLGLANLLGSVPEPLRLLKGPLRFTLEKEENRYYATLEAAPSVSGGGESAVDAVGDLEETLLDWAQGIVNLGGREKLGGPLLKHWDALCELVDFSGLGSKVQNIRDQVEAFHRLTGQPVLESPQVPPDDRVRLRLKLVLEEALELCEASFDPEQFSVRVYLAQMRDAIEGLIFSKLSVDLEKFADALADIDYVVEGARLEFGVRGAPIAVEVHRANMTKAGGPRREDGKQLKPEGWVGPDIRGELMKQGWRP
jgi:predicted HAD superfamily Cof-like phosphohydrolase